MNIIIALWNIAVSAVTVVACLVLVGWSLGLVEIHKSDRWHALRQAVKK